MRSGNYELNRKRLHLEPVLRACVESQQAVASLRKVTIELEVTSHPGPILADAFKIEQVFNNILSNARNSPLKAALSPFLAPMPPKKADYVSDRGPGIPEEFLTAIFKPVHYQVQ